MASEARIAPFIWVSDMAAFHAWADPARWDKVGGGLPAFLAALYATICDPQWYVVRLLPGLLARAETGCAEAMSEVLMYPR